MVGENVFLRAMEPADLQILYEWENATDNWTVSNTTAPFSKHILQKFIETSSQDIYVNRQLRLMVGEKATKKTVGAVDVFDFEPGNRRAGVGILIDPAFRGKGYGLESILLLKNYLFDVVMVHQIFCNVMKNNPVSLRLFQRAGFEICGVKKDWVLTESGFIDEYILQCIRS